MRLQDLLDQRKANFESGASADILKVMHRATDDLGSSDILTRVLKQGDQAPDFTLSDTGGQKFSLSTLIEKGPVVLSFYRGGWDPYCMMELEALQALNSDIKHLDATLIAISPQGTDAARPMIEEYGLTFPILSDTGNQVASKFGLVFDLPQDLIALYRKFGIDLEQINGNTDWQLPMPARFIISRKGTIVDSQVNTDYTKRPEPLKIIDILKQL